MKKFLAGFLAGALTFGAAGAYAAGGNMIEVFYSIKDIKIFGESSMPEQKPFTYKGTTYVPLRYIGESFGLDVAFDPATSSISIDAPMFEGLYGEYKETVTAEEAMQIAADGYYEGSTADMNVEEVAANVYVVRVSPDLGSGNGTVVDAFLVDHGVVMDTLLLDDGSPNEYFWEFVDTYKE